MAERSDITQEWIPVRTFSELGDYNLIPTLTADELMILWRSVNGGIYKNWIATRSSIQEPFSNLIDGDLLNTGTKKACLSSDGLSIYSGDYDEIAKASRMSRNEPFGNPVPIVTKDGNTIRGSFIHITIDGKTLSFWRAEGHFPVEENGIWITELEIVVTHCLPK
jgi:hypothetical protein